METLSEKFQELAKADRARQEAQEQYDDLMYDMGQGFKTAQETALKALLNYLGKSYPNNSVANHLYVTEEGFSDILEDFDSNDPGISLEFQAYCGNLRFNIEYSFNIDGVRQDEGCSVAHFESEDDGVTIARVISLTPNEVAAIKDTISNNLISQE